MTWARLRRRRAFFESVLGELGCAPGDVYFWDDNPENVTTARQMGIKAGGIHRVRRVSPSIFQPVRIGIVAILEVWMTSTTAALLSYTYENAREYSSLFFRSWGVSVHP